MEAWQTLEHILIRCVVGVVLLSVWTLRVNKHTRFRGKGARNMEEEFRVYGLKKRTMYLVGFLKIFISLCFLGGHWAPFMIRPAAVLLAFLMTCAVLFHLKVEKNNYLKVAPAYLLLFFATYLVIM